MSVLGAKYSRELVEQAILAGKTRPQSWWITRHNTVLITNPHVVIWIGDGLLGLKFGIGMPPVFDKNDIAEISVSIADRFRLWSAYREVRKWQENDHIRNALESAGYV